MCLNKLKKSKVLIQSSILGFALSISGCGIIDKHVEWETVEPESYPVLKAIGYAPISSQRGEGDSMKLIMAMKASKLDAYRELTEQVYGQKIEGSQSVSHLVVESESLRASVEGVIRGAEVVKTYPVGEDTYVTELSLDMQQVYDIYLSTAKPRRVKDVKYY
ncbi:flagellar biosynthesis protein FlgP [Alteromonas mediterranea]|uniref:LPP20 family lipoprotein n=1 Tax=Alteromonas mediterranea TaxID=314275 RepID=UPI0009036973|nr:LPP20 family lipoprotein [Alteromonas mediterranea]APD93306.1 flagellar biosynthesis protein FlgP [Alteromonas mediterranea]APD96931.1 flagellar biosynthesis protein FlgP [Alteromonas mediterranea]QDG34047.1 flagellar biosynthesis protein FlgP [Alteromonas mediterranea]